MDASKYASSSSSSSSSYYKSRPWPRPAPPAPVSTPQPGPPSTSTPTTTAAATTTTTISNGEAAAAAAAPTAGKHDQDDTPLHRLDRLALRLHWKSHLLTASHAHAANLAAAQADINSNSNTSSSVLAIAAQQMFRLDFFEFYVLLERALVLALALCGVRVSARAHAPTNDADENDDAAPSPTAADEAPGRGRFIFATRGRGPAIAPPRPPDSRVAAPAAEATDLPPARHAFHANLLRALERPGSPLREVLGSGAARAALGRAKELRNRWKEGSEGEGEVVMIQAAELEELLGAVMGGVDGAVGVVKVRVERGEGGDVGRDAGAMEVEYTMADSVEGPWEGVGDAMEWE